VRDACDVYVENSHERQLRVTEFVFLAERLSEDAKRVISLAEALPSLSTGQRCPPPGFASHSRVGREDGRSNRSLRLLRGARRSDLGPYCWIGTKAR
jgi:hypothetical protein